MATTTQNFLRIACLACIGSAGSVLNAQPVQHVQQLTASDGAASDELGYDVAIAQARMAAGAPRHASVGVQSGAVYVYKQNGDGSWSFQQKVVAPDAQANRFFGYRTSLSGGFGPATNLLAVSTPGDNDNGNQTGAVYVFIETPSVMNPWGFVKKIYSPNITVNSRFGEGIDLENDLLIVGQPGNFHAFIHQRNEGGSNNWGSIATLLPPAPTFNVYAESVGIQGDVAVVSDRGDDDAGSSSGAAYVFMQNTGGANNWGFTKKLVAPDPAVLKNFGHDVDVEGDFIACGAFGDSDLAPRSGAVYLFERDTGGPDNWGFFKKIIPPVGHIDLWFGRDVKFDGDFLVVGTYLDNASGNSGGAAYVYGRDVGGTDNWGLLQKIVNPDAMHGDSFAYDIDIQGDDIVCGLRLDDEAEVNMGSARVFRIASTCPEDLNGDGVVDASDLGILIGAFGTSGPGDINSDGTIDAADLGLLIAGFSAMDCAY